MPDKLAKLLRKDTKRLTKISKPIDVTMKFEASTGTVLSKSPVLTDYGDALVFNGYELFTRNAGGALALVKEGNDWLIVATDGAEDDNRNVHDVFAGEPYLSVSCTKQLVMCLTCRIQSNKSRAWQPRVIPLSSNCLINGETSAWSKPNSGMSWW